MDPTVWILIIGLVLVIAVGIWLLTRKPSSPSAGSDQRQHEESKVEADTRRADEVERYDVGGDHVAAGDAPSHERSTEPYDQEAEEDEHPPVWQEEDSVSQDTATGGDVVVVEGEPADGIHERESEAPRADADDPADGRQQMTYGEAETEDFASETTYADPDREPRDEGSAEPLPSRPDDGQGSENLGPEHGEGDPGVHDEDRGHSGTTSQPEGEAVYAVPAQTGETDHDDIPSDAHAAGFADIDSDPHDSEDETPGTPDVVVVETVEVAEGSGEDVEDGHRQSDPTHDELGATAPGHQEAVGDDGLSADTVVVETETVVVEPVDLDESSEHAEDTREPLVAEEAPADVHPAALDPDTVAGDEETETREDAQQSGDEPRAASGGATALSATSASADHDEHDEHDEHDSDRADAGSPPEREEHLEEEHRSPEDSGLTTSSAPVGEADPVVLDEDGRTDDSSLVGRDDSVADRDHAGHDADPDADPDEHVGDDSRVTDEPTDGEHEEEEPAEVYVVEGPYGPGSAMPAEDGSHPEGYEIKGNAGSMLFHTDDSPVYGDYSPDVWFDSEESAKEAGFAHWDRKRR